jgi:hypothetical protein
VVTDQASLEHVLESALEVDAIVVFDPPMTTGARDRLAAAVAAPLHLTFGAREQRFSADVLRAAQDVRSTLKHTWRQLRDEGPSSGSALEQLLWGDGPHPRSSTAIVHGLRALVGRGLLELDGPAGIRQAPTRVDVASPIA